MSKKSSTPENEPSAFGVVIAAFSMAIFGALIGFVYLASFAPTPFSSIRDRDRFLETKDKEEPESPVAIYYLKGSEATQSTWAQKRDALAKGAVESVAFTGGELNSWMGAKFKPLSESAQSEDEAKPKMEIVPGVPNFFAEDSQSLYVSLPLRMSLFGFEGDHVAFVRGHFSTGQYVEFVPDELYLNSAPIPLTGGLGGQILSRFVAAYSATDEYELIRSTLQRAESVQLIGDSVRIAFR